MEIDGNNGGVRTVEILAGNIEGCMGDASGAEVELDRAEVTVAIAIARGGTVSKEAHGHCAVTGEGDEAETVGDELVVEDGGILLNLDEVDGDGGHLH